MLKAWTRKELIFSLTLVCDLGAGMIKSVHNTLSSDDADVFEVSLNYLEQVKESLQMETMT